MDKELNLEKHTNECEWISLITTLFRKKYTVIKFLFKKKQNVTFNTSSALAVLPSFFCNFTPFKSSAIGTANIQDKNETSLQQIQRIAITRENP